MSPQPSQLLSSEEVDQISACIGDSAQGQQWDLGVVLTGADGPFGAEIFHQAVDDKGPFIAVARTSAGFVCIVIS